MLNINKDIFSRNLVMTQEYCHLQVPTAQTNNANRFRSFNPTVKNRQLFGFEVEHFTYDIRPNLRTCVLARWGVDPFGMIDNLFEQQLRFKKSQNLAQTNKEYEGDILVSLFDCTVVDGASEAESLGFIDVYDMPPIDTWFYLTNTSEGRLLFAWIPKEFEYYVNDAISVNMLDLLNWFKLLYPEDYKASMSK